jgi:3-phenylpropionate/trans-cinnamate dioxygenase ferredoxin reductase subunit
MDPTHVTIAAVREVGPDAVALDIETPPAFDARPGQFVKLTAEVDGAEESRFYTISSPDVEDSFEITVEVDPEGTLGPWLEACDAGDTVELAGPFGVDYYEGEPRVVVLAGGPGIGPAVGIAERALDDGGAAAIVYRDDDPIHEQRLQDLAARGVDVHVIDRDESMADATAEALEGGGQMFVYGFADFLDAALDAIDRAGGESDEAKVENFG